MRFAELYGHIRVIVFMQPLSELCSALENVLGLHAEPAHLDFFQMASRALVVFIWGVILVRVGDRRLLGRNSGFDVLLVVVLGSVLSRGVNGQSAFFPTLGVSAFLVLLHHLLAWWACRSDWVSRWLKGTARVLIIDGRINQREMTRSRMSHDDLDENLRLNGNVSAIDEVREARLERNGTISVLKK